MPRKKTESKAEKSLFGQRIEQILGDSYYFRNEGKLEVTWTTGGMTGGSCWNDGVEDPHYPVEAEEEPEFEALDKVLEALCPQITFLQYKKLVKSVVSRDATSENEYYGNYYDKMTKSVDLNVLKQYLKQNGLWAE
jgi:hypothetical protein